MLPRILPTLPLRPCGRGPCPWRPSARPLTRRAASEQPAACRDRYGLKKQLEHHYKAAKHGEKV
eukprot:787527-Pleurochrysis_carterae.AAC.3